MAVKKERFIATVRQKKIGKRVAKRIQAIINRLDGKLIYIEIGAVRRDRSSNQNKYYWGVIVKTFRREVLEEWGDEIDSEEAHELLKRECNYAERLNEATGQVFRVPQSTRQHTTVQAEEYYERCRRFIYDWFNISVPLPNEDFQE